MPFGLALRAIASNFAARWFAGNDTSEKTLVSGLVSGVMMLTFSRRHSIVLCATARPYFASKKGVPISRAHSPIVAATLVRSLYGGGFLYRRPPIIERQKPQLLFDRLLRQSLAC